MALFDHLLTTDPERFLVAVRQPTPGSSHAREQVIGFGIAVQRDSVWFLSQLYVLPSEQRRGIGHALLSRILPSLPDGTGTGAGVATNPPEDPERPFGVLATCTDSAQPASSGLYSRYGLIPRMPIFNLVGTPATPSVLPSLPVGVEAAAFGKGDPSAAIDAIDRQVLGYAHPLDHRHLRASGRTGFLYRASDGEPLGYGYSSEAGRFGPVALLDDTLTAPVLGHLMGAIKPRGATSAWVPGANDRAMVALLRAGLRIEGFPALLGWTRPFGAFDRYLPASLALL
jgi:GNAT superfamily N-acetyltransferase